MLTQEPYRTWHFPQCGSKTRQKIPILLETAGNQKQEQKDRLKNSKNLVEDIGKELTGTVARYSP
jgi:hypothetical protein